VISAVRAVNHTDFTSRWPRDLERRISGSAAGPDVDQ